MTDTPAHVAIILDGNGRWAQRQKMPRVYGHTQGAKNVEKIVEAAGKAGIRYLTVYAFSTENWKRPKEEVAALMRLLRQYLKNCRKTARENEMRVRVLGDISGLAADIQESIRQLETFSAAFDRIHLQIAINYGGRDEITRAVKKLAASVEAGVLSAKDITPQAIASALDTGGIPDPDLLIRTGGELRISNFLLWQLAYTEFYFTEVSWPDFDAGELAKAVDAYRERKRRYGSV